MKLFQRQPAERRSSRPRLGIESLETRTVLSTISMANGVLTINGSEANDVVTFTSTNTHITATIKHKSGSTQITDDVETVAKSALTKIVFNGFGGNDSFNNSTGVSSEAFGGAGNDTLVATAGADTIWGGTGNDNLQGGSGHDILRGGTGNDFLYGGSGNDRLFGDANVDTLAGDSGNDWLEAGSLAETVTDSSGLNWNAHQWAKGGTSAGDVQQQESPTCVFLAALGAAAAKGMDLQSRITYLGNYQYQVQLFLPNVGMAIPWTKTVTFDGFATVLDPASRNQEFWTILYQRAYLKMCDELTLDSADHATALSAITGRTAYDFSGFDSPIVLAQMLNAGYIGTAGQADNTAWTVANHAYTIMALEQVNGTWYITLRNPWGVDGGLLGYENAYDGIIKMTWDSFYNTCDFDGIWIS